MEKMQLKTSNTAQTLDTETIVNDTFSDNDSDTIPYQESDSETASYKETDSDNEQCIDLLYMTKSGRQIKRKCPFDYEDQ